VNEDRRAARATRTVAATTCNMRGFGLTIWLPTTTATKGDDGRDPGVAQPVRRPRQGRAPAPRGRPAGVRRHRSAHLPEALAHQEREVLPAVAPALAA